MGSVLCSGISRKKGTLEKHLNLHGKKEAIWAKFTDDLEKTLSLKMIYFASAFSRIFGRP